MKHMYKRSERKDGESLRRVMSSQTIPRFSLIIPSRGDRPKALTLALDHIDAAARKADLTPDRLRCAILYLFLHCTNDFFCILHLPVQCIDRPEYRKHLHT